MLKVQKLSLLMGISALALTTTQAMAQKGDTGIETVTVTGSRVAREGFTTPTPTTAISAEELDNQANLTVGDIVTTIPSLVPNRVANASTNIGSTTFNLRNIGASRTLVLLDGMRLEDSSPTGGFNVNLLPAQLIKSIEIVTGGASAAYGSDAITGVVNVSLISSLQGGKLDFQQQSSNYADDRATSINFAYGHGFDGGKGQVLFAASLYNQPKSIYEYSRPWGRLGYTLFNNTKDNIAAGQSAFVIGPGGTLAQETYGGVLTSGPAGVKNVQFGAGGVQSTFYPGGYCGGTNYCQNGDGTKTYLPQTGPGSVSDGTLLPTGKRDNLYLKGSFNITPSLQVWGSILFAYDNEIQTNVPNYNNGDISVTAQNPFMPANIVALLTAAKVTSVLLGRETLEGGTSINRTTTQYLRYVGGFQGDLPFFNGWSYDAHMEYTQAFYFNETANNRDNQRWAFAVDSVANPAVGGVAGVAVGAPVCRDTLTNPNDGCIPANVFGTNMISQSSVTYFDGNSYTAAWSTETDFAGNVRGNLFDTWAGPISSAIGGEYRRNTINLKSDPRSQAQVWRQASSQAFYGANEVREGYVESVIPLAPKDTPFIQKLELDLAARIADYDSSGTAFVWKIGGNYAVDDNVRFRATYSRDYRAPSINELYSSPIVANGGTVLDRQPGALFGQTENTQTQTGGNPNLKPEQSITLTEGVVLTPQFIPGLMVSVDAYNIRMANALTGFTAQQVVNDCYGFGVPVTPAFCSGITRSAITGQITKVNATQFNAQVLKVNGIDLEGSYTFPLEDIWSEFGTGSMTFADLATYEEHIKTISNGILTEDSGFLTGTDATPHWRSVFTATYTDGPVLVEVLMNYVGPGFYSNTQFTLAQINEPHWSGQTYFNLLGHYDVTDRVQIYGKIDNALNRSPPLFADQATLKALASSSPYYDTVGRLFGLGIRYNW